MTKKGLKLILSFAIITSSSAALLVEKDRGEICQLSTFETIKYKKDDIKKAKKLCAIDFYNPDNYYQFKKDNVRTGVCPKLVNTNPGIELYALIDGPSKSIFENSFCHSPRRPAKKLAKYKVSTSCGYSPAMMAYFHFSRLLNIGNVPIAVYRTMDIKAHQDFAQKGVRYSSKQKGWIKKNWITLQKKLNAGPSSSSAKKLMTSDGNYSYGALMENPRGEASLNSFHNGGSKKYLQSKWMKILKRKKAITRTFSQNKSNLENIFLLKDFSDMLLIDFIMSQHDRYGNIHYKKYFYYQKDGKLKRQKYQAKNAKTMKERGAVVVKRMLLKDNDCGLRFANDVQNHKALEKLQHFSQETFLNLKRTKTLSQTIEFKQWLKNDLHFQDDDLEKITHNIAKAYAILSKGISTGRITLDLNPESFWK